MERHKKILWVDLLCWNSAPKVLSIARRNDIQEVRYVNVHATFAAFVAGLSRMIGKPVVQVTSMVESELKCEGMSLYEFIHLSVNNILEGWADGAEITEYAESFCRKHQMNPDKFKAHLKEKAFFQVFRPVSLWAYSQCLNKSRDVILVHQTPFKRFLEALFQGQEIEFYHLFLLRKKLVDTRTDYIYDRYGKDEYFSGAVGHVGQWVGAWMLNVISMVMVRLMRNSRPVVLPGVKIGVELTQHRVRPDEINDVSWLESLGGDRQHVIYLQLGGQYDEESLRWLDAQGVSRCRVVRNPLLILKQMVGLAKKDGNRLVAADAMFPVKTLFLMPGVFKSLIFWDQKGWLRFQARTYLCRTYFWSSIYRQLGIKLVFTMFDMDEDKLPKGQAVECLGGLYSGGHWSNYIFYKIDNHKCFDVVFTWGEHFIRSSFNRYPHDAIFLTGYVCDYYFKDHREKAEELRKKHEGKFILSYHDNAMGNDIPASMSMQLDIHRMLISLLRKFDQVVVFLKPKRKYVWEEILRELPEFNKLIKDGRVEVFLGETERTKAVPALIGMASDLVIGLGISTSAAEAFFAGTVAFHADFTGFERNEFANRGLGSVVFRDAFSLENAVIEHIRGKNAMSYDEYRGYYTCLDPFQDGWSAKRVGFIMKKIREYLDRAMGRREILQRVSKDYDAYLISLPNLQRMSWN